MAGFVLKSHYTSTAERASVVRAAVPGIEALGAISLNRAVGGMNPLAVEIAAREGARTVWMPTVDSVNESHERDAPPGAKVPVWVRLQLDLREQGLEIEPVPVVDDDGAVLPETREVLAMIARHGMLLATGHLGRDEIFAVVDAALEEGVQRDRDHPSRVPVAEPLGRGPARARASAARCSSAASPRRTPARSPGSAWIDNIRADRRRALGAVDRPRPGRSTRRSRTAWR